MISYNGWIVLNHQAIDHQDAKADPFGFQGKNT